MTSKQKARELNEKTTDIAHQIICCKGCYQLGKDDRDKEMLDKIELYFVYCLLNKKVPRLEELKQRLKGDK